MNDHLGWIRGEEHSHEGIAVTLGTCFRDKGKALLALTNPDNSHKTRTALRWITLLTLGAIPSVGYGIEGPSHSWGTHRITWEKPPGLASYVWEKRGSGAAQEVYAGTAAALTISGRQPGVYQYALADWEEFCAPPDIGCFLYPTEPKNSASWLTITVLPKPGDMGALNGPSSSASGSYAVSWPAVPNANRYEIQEKLNDETWRTVHDGAALSVALQVLQNGTYRYKGRACNEGGCTAESPPKIVEVDRVPTVPTQLTSPGSSSHTLTISWGAAALANNYTLHQRMDGGTWSSVYTGAAPFSELTGLSPGSYDFRVQACNMQGCSEFSDIVTTQVVSAPVAAPTLTVPEDNATGRVDIRWSPVTGATDYILQQRRDGGSWSTIYEDSAASHQAAVYSDDDFDFRVQACNVAGCSGWSTVATTHVALAINSDEPPAPAGMPVLDAADIKLADQTGAISGEFRVDESGAANYRIPILALPGTAGVTPEVALEYSSQRGQGLVGHGWVLAGAGQISRCRQTLASDGIVRPISWTEQDRFCLDGQRLVLAPGETRSYGDVGTVYHTEIESYVRVSSMGGTVGHPDYFVVERKDGSLSRYGDVGNHDSEQRAWQDDGTETDYVLNWKISRFQDSVGNPIDYVYHEAVDSHRLREMRYAYGDGNLAAASIRLAYETRPDPIRGYIAGYPLSETARLKRIDTFNGLAPVQSLHLNYEQYSQRSFLASLEQCNGPSKAICLPPTTFDWSQPAAGFMAHTGSRSLDGDGVVDTKLADINGDGVLDMVYLTLDQDGSSDTDYYLLYMLTVNGKPRRTSFANGAGSIFFGDDQWEGVRIQIIDYNGDGRQDVAVYAARDGRWRIMLASPQSDGSWKLDSNWINSGIEAEDAVFVDVSGDGLQDAVYLAEGPGGYYRLVYRQLEVNPTQSIGSDRYYRFASPVTVRKCSQPNACTTDLTLFWPGVSSITTVAKNMFYGDFNGDGRLDIGVHAFFAYGLPVSGALVTSGLIKIYTFNSADEISLFHEETTDGSPEAGMINKPPIVGDINNDGYDDLIYSRYRYNYTRHAQYHLSDGKALMAPVTFNISNTDTMNDPGNVYPQFVTDLYGDGRIDIAWHRGGSKNRLEYQTWDPATGNISPVSIAFNTGSSSIARLADITGDGVTDLLRLGSNEVRFYPGATGPNAAFKIVKVTDGVGKTTAIDYETLSLSDHYQRLTMGISLKSDEMTVTLPPIVGGGSFTYPYTMSYADKDTFYSALNGGWALGEDEHNLGKDRPVLEFAGPVPIVTRVESTAPKGHAVTPGQVETTATSAISYHYGEAKLQAAGRGFLGFHKIRTIDEQSGIETTTTYRQDYPFLGYPQETLVERLEGEDRITLKYSHNLYDFQNWGDGHQQGPYRPVLKQVREWSYDYTGAHLASYTETAHQLSNGAPSHDEWGNLADTTVSVFAGYDEQAGPQNLVSVKRTVNEYHPPGMEADYAKRFGRLSLTDVLHYIPDAATPAVLRRSSFSYYTSGAAKGLLKEETVQPGTNDELRTRYSYDAYGNKIRVETTGAAGKAGAKPQVRTARYVYDSFGRYIDQTIALLPSGAEHVTEQVISRNGFGLPTRVRDGDSVNTFFTYGDMGRRYLSYTETGAWQSTLLRPADHGMTSTHCPFGTTYSEHTRQAGGGQSLACYDALLRTSRSAKLGFDGSWIYQDREYDSSGRLLRQSEPYFAGSTRYWTHNNYDPIGRLTHVEHPFSVTASETTRYSYAHVGGLSEVVITDPSGKVRRERRNALGQLVRSSQMDATGTGSISEVHHLYTATGDLRQVTTYGADYADGVAGPVTITMQYDDLGRKVAMSDPDKGAWSYAYNAFGELVEQIDARGWRSELTYDSNGRISHRTDYGNTGYGSTGSDVLGTTSWIYDAHDSLERPGKLLWVDHASYDKGSLESYQQLHQYDDLGRPAGRGVMLGAGGFWMETVTYDQYGREFQRFDATGGERGIQNIYNSQGYLKGIKDTARLGSLNMVNIYHAAGPGEVYYYQVHQMDAHGRVVEATLGNGKTIYNSYDPLQGYLTRTQAGTGAPTIGTVQDLQMTYDLVGNLLSRTDHLGSRVESFTYDHLNRLTAARLDGQLQQLLSYDGLGNIKLKTDMGAYGYGAGTAGPHAVTATSLGALSYEYDANGNLIRYSSGGSTTRELAYTAFDKPWRITAGGHVTEFSYNHERQRYKRSDTGPGGTTTTLYAGNVEWITGPDGKSEIKRYIGQHLVITMFQDGAIDDSQPRLDYLLRDHLGSVTVVLDKQGNVTSKLSFDPWGQRRSADWQSVLDVVNDWTSISNYIATTSRGFTGHEMLDQVGLIHMNGRVYDPRLAKFLSADPFVQAVGNAQSYNRYSYTFNNPLNASDPSGYFIFTLAASILTAAEVFTGIEIVYAFAAAGFVDTLAQGGSFGDAIKQGVISGVTAGAFSWAAGIDFSGLEGFADVARVGTIGAVGGVTEVLAGGKFGHGFVAAGLGASVSYIPGLNGSSPWARAGKVLARAVVGGTASEISGGKFSNGAAYAAFAAAVSDSIQAAQRQKVVAPTPERITDINGPDVMKEMALNIDPAEFSEEVRNYSVPRLAPYSRQGVLEEVIVRAQPLGCNYCYDRYLHVNSGALFAGGGSNIRDPIDSQVWRLARNYFIRPAIIAAGANPVMGAIGLSWSAWDVRGHALTAGKYVLYGQGTVESSLYSIGAIAATPLFRNSPAGQAATQLYMQAVGDTLVR